MIFNNRGRLKTGVLRFNSSIIENVRSYTYLGITFSVSGAFTEAKPQHLYEKGLKAYFKLIQRFDGHKPNIKTLIHIFDHTVKPVLMYGSEICGYFHGFRLSSKDNFFIKLCNSTSHSTLKVGLSNFEDLMLFQKLKLHHQHTLKQFKFIEFNST
jgi:hypothetical protein